MNAHLHRAECTARLYISDEAADALKRATEVYASDAPEGPDLRTINATVVDNVANARMQLVRAARRDLVVDNS